MLAALLLPLAWAALMGSSVLIGDMIVVGKEVKRQDNLVQICVSYRAYGGTQTTCVPGTTTESRAATTCFDDAQIGHPLPESCRGRGR